MQFCKKVFSLLQYKVDTLEICWGQMEGNDFDTAQIF